ncbi:unnamed protein product [Clonostachys rosea f. rosea IK726]|uniref:Uncharacterized protein n=1 Tax=Clonostachys rosea f. rosea IK726 TaxID=1349383 RepID=A0ACA9UEP1_BIOOC|nr:unnamed protein product [Clonostachys rosea f. rosea IK726]
MSLLQAVVLTTFAELIKGVRARAWRSVGTCVRVAYERQLHLIDADSEPGTIQAETWVVEEQRRTWWAIWELDVFASTVRRSPTAIDWDTNETFLPVDDEFWFACTPQPSCFLERDPEMRWKSLQASKNLSPKAWFIAINSIMRNAQVLSNPRGGARNVAVRRDPSAPSRHPPKALKQARRSVTESTDDLSILNNSLYCFLMALPDHLRHRGGFLAFCDDPTRGRSRQLDSDIYSIHIMTQLARFMISRENLYWEVEKESPSPHQEDPQLDHLPDTTEGERRWKCYLDTADGIMDIVSSSSPDHFQHINPFLGSTIWLGAAILLVHFRLAPSKPLVNCRLIESKFDLLQAVLVKLSSWWGMSTILTDRLSLLQSGLQYPGEGNRSANTAHPHRPQSQLQNRASFDWSITQDQSDPPLVTSEEGGTVEPSHDEPANPLDQHRILGPGDSPVRWILALTRNKIEIQYLTKTPPRYCLNRIREWVMTHLACQIQLGNCFQRIQLRAICLRTSI